MAALQTCLTVGMPGCRTPLAELIAYLSDAPKSTRSYEGYNRAEELAKRDLALLVPIAMRDINASAMEEIGHGEVYRYQPEYLCASSSLFAPSLCSDIFCFHILRHPVTNEYLPPHVQGEVILRKEGDLSDKLWDEEALRRWEEIENGGRDWKGRLLDETIT